MPNEDLLHSEFVFRVSNFNFFAPRGLPFMLERRASRPPGPSLTLGMTGARRSRLRIPPTVTCDQPTRNSAAANASTSVATAVLICDAGVDPYPRTRAGGRSARTEYTDNGAR